MCCVVQFHSLLLTATMGNATSKAARKLPKRSETPSWTGSGSTISQSKPKKPVAKEHKDQGGQTNHIAFSSY